MKTFSQFLNEAEIKGSHGGINYIIKNAPLSGKNRYYVRSSELKGNIQHTPHISHTEPTITGAHEHAKKFIDTHKEINPFYYGK